MRRIREKASLGSALFFVFEDSSHDVIVAFVFRSIFLDPDSRFLASPAELSECLMPTAKVTLTDRCWFIRLLFMGVFEFGVFQPRMDANARESWNVIRVHQRSFAVLPLRASLRRLWLCRRPNSLFSGLFADRILVR